METLIITSLNGETELLIDYTGLKRIRKVNADYSLSFTILKTEKNQHAYPLVIEENTIEYDGQQYRIKDMTELLVGITPIKTVQASHIFFDLVDTYKYDSINNTQTISTCIGFALQGTGYTFDVIDPFPNAVFEKFGEDTSLALLQMALNVFGAEVKINNKHLRIYHQIGAETEVQVRYGYNVKTLEKYVNTNNLSTRIRGFGKKNEDGSYVVTAEYTSPMAAIYGIRDAKPIHDERYTDYSSLLERIQSELIDEPQIGFKVDALELKKMGVLTEQLYEGDRVFVIYEPLGIDLTARVLEIVDYPESSQPAEYTFGNFLSNFTNEMAGFQKTKDNIDAIFNGEKKLPYNVLDDAVLRATESLHSALTELIFDNGIIARDPNNPNHLVLLNSKGIGISKDGGATFTEAITADGFVLSAGAIGQLNANNITVGPGTNFYEGYDPNAIKEALKKEVDDVSKALGNLGDTINTTFRDGIITEAEAKSIAAYINIINTEKADVDNKYDMIYSDVPSTDAARANLYSAKNSYNTAHTNLISSINSAIADGKTTVAEKQTVDNRFSVYRSALATLSTRFEQAVRAIENAKVKVVDDVLQVWKYPNTTQINGGSIFTNTIDVNKLKAGILTGFVMQTNDNPYLPRIYMGGSKFEATNGDSKIVIDTMEWNGYAGLTIQTGSSNMIFQSYDDRNMLSSNGSELEIWAFNGVGVRGDFTVQGSKNASVPTSIGRVNISAYETAEYYFGDIGRGNVVEGECKINIESLFAETVNTNIDYEVFLTPYGRGVIYVDPKEMQPDHFIVRGNDIPFAYEIKAKRLGYEDVRLELSKESEVAEFVQDTP